MQVPMQVLRINKAAPCRTLQHLLCLGIYVRVYLANSQLSASEFLCRKLRNKNSVTLNYDASFPFEVEFHDVQTNTVSCLSAASCTQSSVCHVFPQLLVLNAQFVMSFRSFLYSKLSLSCLSAASCTQSSVCHVFPQLLVLKAQFVMSSRSFLY